jgi:hypothetical protein
LGFPNSKVATAQVQPKFQHNAGAFLCKGS